MYNNVSKKYMTLTADKLIFYKGSLKKSFDRKKIQGIKLTEGYKVSILYGKEVYSLELGELSVEELERVKRILDELNKKGILFYAEDNKTKEVLYLIACIILWGLSIYSAFAAISFEYIFFVMGLVYFIGFLYLKYSLEYSYRILYETNSNYFEIMYGINKIIKIPLSNTQYKIKYDRENHKYLLTKKRKKIISFYNGVIYPLYYKDHLNKMMKIKLDIN